MVTTSIYDFIKDRIHRKRVTPAEERLLTAELKTAVQLLKREVPEEVVQVGSVVSILDHTSETHQEFQVVGIGKSKRSKGKYSMDSSIALATLGRKVGSLIEWPFKDGTRKIEILRVKNPS